MSRVIFITLAASVLFGCTDAGNAQRVLESAGYTNIQITGYDWFACSEDDTLSTGFTAIGPTGKPVKGAVCSGLIFKNSTIRLN